MNTERLKMLRKSHKISQKEIAAILGFSQQRYNFYETGRNEPDNETLINLADYFKVSTDYLLGTTDDPTPPGAKKEGPLSSEEALWGFLSEKLGHPPTKEDLEALDLAADIVISRIKKKKD